MTDRRTTSGSGTTGFRTGLEIRKQTLLKVIWECSNDEHSLSFLTKIGISQFVPLPLPNRHQTYNFCKIFSLLWAWGALLALYRHRSMKSWTTQGTRIGERDNPRETTGITKGQERQPATTKPKTIDMLKGQRNKALPPYDFLTEILPNESHVVSDTECIFAWCTGSQMLKHLQQKRKIDSLGSCWAMLIF